MDKVRRSRLTPRRIWFIDNSRGFGHRDERVHQVTVKPISVSTHSSAPLE